MPKTIYLVVCKGHKQSLWFESLEKAQAYCKEYGPNSHSIHRYQYDEKVAEAEPKPLYKKFW